MYKWTELDENEVDACLEAEILNSMKEEDFEEYLRLLAKERA